VTHASNVVETSGTSFYWAMRLLPAAKRDAMYAIYAFCRSVDDIADDTGSASSKMEQLQAWRQELDALYGGNPTIQLGQALDAPVRDFRLAKQDFLAVIDGMEMDAADAVRIADESELALYCDRVACAVGRLSTRVFEIDDEMGLPLAKSLGEALQLTNILRDVDEDAERDRVYLPKTVLNRYGIDEEHALAIISHPRLHQACGEIANLAEIRYAEAASHVRNCDATKVRPAAIMMNVYHRLFERLSARGWRAPRIPVRVPTTEKTFVVLKTFLFGA